MSWTPITCQQREALVDQHGRYYNGFSTESGIGPLASRTDLDGEFGAPSVFTEWGWAATEQPLLRDYRWPDSDRACEHYQWTQEATHA